MTGTYAPLLEHAHDAQGIGLDDMNLPKTGIALPNSVAGDDHEALTFHPLPSVKDTNPKDAIGIRKAPLSVVPMGVVVEMGVGMLEGTAKYGRHNYRGVGVRSSVYFDATMRHLIAFWEGEDLDPDSGMSHITKALCSLAVWRDAQIQGKCEDDRPPRSVAFYPDMNKKAGEILDKHAGKHPKHWTIGDAP